MTQEAPMIGESEEPLSKAQLKKLLKEKEKAEKKAANQTAQAAQQYQPPKLDVSELQTS